jgi:hypothetical protein
VTEAQLYEELGRKQAQIDALLAVLARLKAGTLSLEDVTVTANGASATLIRRTRQPILEPAPER